MKRFLLLFSLAAALTLWASGLRPLLQGQQADQDPAPGIPHAHSAAPQQNEAQMPASGDATTHEAKTFTGRIVREDGEFVLQDPVTKVIYKLDDTAKARQYIGRQVKVTGKLDMNNNTILIESIEALP